MVLNYAEDSNSRYTYHFVGIIAWNYDQSFTNCLQAYHIVITFQCRLGGMSKLSNPDMKKAALPLFFLLFFGLSLLVACGGTAVSVPLNETAVSAPKTETGTPVPTTVEIIETAVSTNTASATSPPTASTQPESIPISVAPVATTTFDQAGLASGGGNFISLDDPEMIAATAATWLDGDDIVIGVVQNGEARAYPIKQAAYHHVINDTIGGEPYLVTY